MVPEPLRAPDANVVLRYLPKDIPEQAENLIHRTFVIGTGRLITLRDVAAEIRKHFPNASLQIGGGLDLFKLGFLGYVVLDISRARAELGYEPLYSLAAGIQDCIETLRVIQSSSSPA